MLNSLHTGVSGLNSFQAKMDVIGNNIANVNTYGYKTSRMTFKDIYYKTTKNPTFTDENGEVLEREVNKSQVGYGTSVASIDKIMSRSSFQQTGRPLDFAIAGDGFVQVMDKAGNKFYTRAGNIQVDNYGNVVDSMGNAVLGQNNPSIKPYDVGDEDLDEYNGEIVNIPAEPGSARLHVGLSGLALGTAQTTPDSNLTVTAPDGTDIPINLGFINGNLPAGVDITIEIAPEATVDTAEETYDSQALYDNSSNIILNIVLGGATSPKGITNIEQLIQRVNNAIAELDTKLQYGPFNISMGNFPKGLSSADNQKLKQDALDAVLDGVSGLTLDSSKKIQTMANLTEFFISEEGLLIGQHPTLGTIEFGRLDLAYFDNPDGLYAEGNSYFSETPASGEVKYATPGSNGTGSIVGGALESSNVDLAQMFSDLIVTQRGFQANAKIITTSDEILQEITNFKR